MKSKLLLGSLLLLLVAAAQVSAHFVWVAVAKDSAGTPNAFVWFSELAEADNADLLDKITTIKAWSRSPTAKPVQLQLTKKSDGAGGALVGPIAADVKALSAHIKYGVLTRREQTFLLQYYAKYLDASAPDLKVLARDEALVFDVVPQQTAGGMVLEVLFNGKPVAGSEVVIIDPASTETTAKTDEAGRVSLTGLKSGLYSIRAKWVVTESGKEGDKEYSQVNHYSTLALRVPAQPAAGNAP